MDALDRIAKTLDDPDLTEWTLVSRLSPVESAHHQRVEGQQLHYNPWVAFPPRGPCLLRSRSAMVKLTVSYELLGKLAPLMDPGTWRLGQQGIASQSRSVSRTGGRAGSRSIGSATC